MRVENHNGLGNPNHNELGQFSSASGSGNAKRTNINKTTNSINNSAKNPSNNNIINQKKPNVAATPTVTTNKKQNMFKPNKVKQNDFASTKNEIKNSTPMKIASFVLSGFNFNKLKGIRKLNDKMFVKKQVNNEVIPQKVSTNQMQNLHKEGVAINNGLNQTKTNIDYITEMKNIYQQKFGNNQKMFEKWWEKSNLKKSLIANAEKQQQLMKQKQEHNRLQRVMQKQLIDRNKFLQGGMK